MPLQTVRHRLTVRRPPETVGIERDPQQQELTGMGAFQGTETVTRSSLVAAWTLFACMPAPVGAVDCSFRDQRSGTVLEREVALSGRASQTFSASIPGGNYLIVASERGVDVQVASLLPAQSPAIADSPFARMGDQLLALSVPATTTLTLELAGKDDPKANGTARVKVQAVSTACLTALRPVIDAHASYARAERVRRGIYPTAARDAQTEYRSATQALRTAVDDPVIAADAHMHAALKLELAIALYEGSKEWSAAAEAAESARNAYEALNDEYAIATADAIRATALMEMALTANAGERLAKARELLASVIATHAARGEIYEQALAQNNLGLSFFYEGRADEALSAFREALELHESLHEPMRRAQVLQNMAVVHLDSGRFTRAVPEYEDVLSSLSRDAYPHLYGSVLNNSALANAVVGNLDVALERYATALAIWTELQNPREQARSRNGLGYVYYLAGDYERAQDFYEQALVQRTAALDGSGRASTLRTLGNLYRMSGRPQIALAMHREALGLAANAIARDGALIQIARDFAALPDRSRALAVLDWVTNDSKNPDALTIAYAELERGRVRLSAGDLEGVGSGIEDALNAFRTNDLTGEQIECLIEQWVDAGRNVGSMIARTLRLLDAYGAPAVSLAVAAMIERGTSDLGALAILCEQHRRRRPPWHRCSRPRRDSGNGFRRSPSMFRRGSTGSAAARTPGFRPCSHRVAPGVRGRRHSQS